VDKQFSDINDINFKYRWGSELLRQSDVVLTTKANTSLLVAPETAAKPTGGRK
jgi:hypothetical protein